MILHGAGLLEASGLPVTSSTTLSYCGGWVTIPVDLEGRPLSETGLFLSLKISGDLPC